MNYIAATYFDDKTWPKYGLNWLRSAKSAKLTGLIIGTDLPEEATSKAAELGFKVVPLEKKGGTELDRYSTLAAHLEKGQRCLFTQPDVLPKGGFSVGRDVFCERGKMACIDVVSPIRNLFDRAKAAKEIYYAVQKPNNGLLSSRFMLATWDFWIAFLGFQTYLHERGYLDPRPPYDVLMLNYFMASVGKSFSLEITGENA